MVGSQKHMVGQACRQEGRGTVDDEKESIVPGEQPSVAVGVKRR